jgi:hypothetical protein
MLDAARTLSRVRILGHYIRNENDKFPGLGFDWNVAKLSSLGTGDWRAKQTTAAGRRSMVSNIDQQSYF